MDRPKIELDEVTLRFAGDSGDGMQLTGTQFSHTVAQLGVDVNTFPDYPAEIRSPEGTLYGVSSYSVNAGAKVHTSGDYYDLLIAMNASSLKVNLNYLKKGGIIITNNAGFSDKILGLAKYESNPLEDGSLSDYKLIDLNINDYVKQKITNSSLSVKVIEKTKNFFALGMAYFIYNLPLNYTEEWLKQKFKSNLEIADINIQVLYAGYEYAKNDERIKNTYTIKNAKLKPGYYRNITGNEAIAMGLVAASKISKVPVFLGSYPITPATEILHKLSEYKSYGIKTFQAEDEIAGICSAIGAAYGGYIGVTTTSGPGLSLKVEAMGYALMAELPLVIIDVQRVGPSTGIPTKPEQSDLNLAFYGRHGEAPLPVLAPSTAYSCFEMVIEAVRIATKYMVPVILLSGGYIAQGTQVLKIPEVSDLPKLDINYYTDKETYAPYKRDKVTFSRPWAIPGTPGLEHRIGGLEKEDMTGNQSSNAQNHQKMVEFRAKKIEAIANDIPDASVYGEETGDLLILGWGSTFGSLKTAWDHLNSKGHKVSFCHLHYLNPFPKNLGKILKGFKQILVPESNMGQLAGIIRSKFIIDVLQFNLVEGRPFKAIEIEDKVLSILEKGNN